MAVRSLVFLHCPRYCPPVSHFVCACGFEGTYRSTGTVITVDRYAGQSVVRCFSVSTSGVRIVCRKYSRMFARPTPRRLGRRTERGCRLPTGCVLYIKDVRREGGTLLTMGTLPKVPRSVRLILIKGHACCAGRVSTFVGDRQLRGHIRLLRSMAFRCLPTVCRRTRVFICPSQFRNFKVPVVRTLRSNVPIVTTAKSYLRRTNKPSSLCMRPSSGRNVAGTVYDLLGRPRGERRVVRRNLGCIAHFSRRERTRRLVGLCHSLARRGAV